MCWKTVSKATDFVGITDTAADQKTAEDQAYLADRMASKSMQDMGANYSSATTGSDTAESADYTKVKNARIASLGNRTINTSGAGLLGGFTTSTASAKKKTLG